MKTFEHTSASQMDTFADAEAAPHVGGEGCNRAWWFEKILGLPKPFSAAAQRGSMIHKTLENHMLKGAPLTPDLEKWAKPYIPSPAAIKDRTIQVEKSFRIPVGSTGIALVGFADLYGKFRIDDWKTSSDSQWFKSKEELQKNTQMLLYGYINALEFSTNGKETISLAHNQLLVPRNSTTVTWSQRTEATVTVAETLSFWKERAIPLTERMKEVAVLDDPSLVTPNWNACGRFGGCAFRAQCGALKGAGAGGPTRNPFASHPVPTTPEKTMPPIIKPVIKSPGLAAALGRAQAPTNPAPSVAAGATQGTLPAPGQRATSVPGHAVGITPPDAPKSSAGGMPAAKEVVAATPAPAATPVFTEKQKADAVLGLGWAAEEIEQMDAATFERVFVEKAQRDTVDLEMAEDDQGPYIAGFTVRPPPAPVVEPVVETPAPRRRGPIQQDSVEVRDAAKLAAKAKAEAKPPSVTVGATREQQTSRRPRSAEPRLMELGYTDKQIALMSTDTMQVLLLKDGVPASRVSVLADGRATVFAEPVSGGAEIVLSEEIRQVAEETFAEANRQEALDAAAPDEVDGVNDAMASDIDDPSSDNSAMQEHLDVARELAERYRQQVVNLEKAYVEIQGERDELFHERNTLKAEASSGSTTQAPGLALYIDAFPQKGLAYTDFADFIAPHHDAVAKANGVEHIDDHDKLFGRGPGMIASRLLLAGNRPKGVLYVDTKHPYAAACLAVLTRFATTVVRGTR